MMAITEITNIERSKTAESMIWIVVLGKRYKRDDCNKPKSFKFQYLQLDDWWYVGEQPHGPWGVKCVESWDVVSKNPYSKKDNHDP